MVFGLDNKTPRKDSVDANKKKNMTKEARTKGIANQIIHEIAQDAISENGIESQFHTDTEEGILSSSLLHERHGSNNNLTNGSMNNSSILPEMSQYPNNLVSVKNSNENRLANGNTTSGLDGDDEKEFDKRTRWSLFEILDGPYESGRLLLSEVMKLGIIIGFISSLEGIHDWLLRNPSLIGAVYRAWHFALQMVSLMITFVTNCCFKTICFAWLVFTAIAPIIVTTEASRYYKKVLASYYEIDHYLSEKLSDLIEHHPWTKETFLKLIQIAFHYFLGIFENQIGFPIRQRIADARIIRMLFQFTAGCSQPRSEADQNSQPTTN